LKKILTGLAVLLSMHAPTFAQTDAEKIIVAITPTLSTTTVNHRGTPITIKRIQDTNHKLLDDFARTSRPCPPFCIQPMHIDEAVETVGELDVLAFLNKEVVNGSGLLVDARMPKFHNSETIPGSVNIPFVLFTSSAEDILPLLGAIGNDDGTWDFSRAKSLMLWCNGPWCAQSPRAILALRALDYPADKMTYYRGGMQLWKVLGLTTISPAAERRAQAAARAAAAAPDTANAAGN